MLSAIGDLHEDGPIPAEGDEAVSLIGRITRLDRLAEQSSRPAEHESCAHGSGSFDADGQRPNQPASLEHGEAAARRFVELSHAIGAAVADSLVAA